VLDTRKILVLARCTRRCRLEVRAILRVPSRQPIVLPVNADGSSAPQRAARLQLRASRKAFSVIRSALTRGPPVAVILRVRASDGDGGSAVEKERIRLKPVPDRGSGSP